MKEWFNIIIIFLISLNFIISQPKNGEDYFPIPCGKQSPKNPKDCTKYGTDSGMVCCWVSNGKNDNEGKCVLIYNERAKEIGISGDHTFNDAKEDIYWNCGNKSIYLNINIILIFISLLLFLIS